MLLFRVLFRETVRKPYVDLQRIEQERAAVLNALPDMILELDDARRIRAIRHTKVRFAPIIDSFAPGRRLDECLGPGWCATLDAAFWMAQTEKTHVVARPFLVTGPAGTPLAFVLTLSRLDGGDGLTPGWLVVIRDDTENARKRSQAERLSTVLSKAPLPMAIFDATAKPTFLNDAFRTRAQMWNAPDVPPAILDDDRIESRLERGRSLRREVTHAAADGTTVTEMQYAFPLLGPTGAFDGAMVCVEDVTERRAAQDRFERLLNYDDLTGLPRETVLADRLKQAVATAKTGRQNAVVLRLDLDGFAGVNDALGRRSGDRVLRHLTETLRAALDPRALLSRESSDNFVILMLDLPTDEVPRLVNTILQVVNLPLAIGRETIRVTTCVGVASYPDDGTTFESLASAAEAALHDAKSRGPGNWRSYSPTLRAPVARFMTISAHLADAIDANEFSLAFQPKMRADGAHLTGAEVLLRWHSRTLGRSVRRSSSRWPKPMAISAALEHGSFGKRWPRSGAGLGQGTSCRRCRSTCRPTNSRTEAPWSGSRRSCGTPVSIPLFWSSS